MFLRATTPYILIFAVLLMLYSCEKEASFGSDSINNDPLHVVITDTTTLYAYSVKDSLLPTDEGASSAKMATLGSWNDPIFGKTQSTLFTSFALKDSLTVITIDKVKSITLSLAYTALKVNQLSDLTFSVYEIASDATFDTSQIYYSNQALPYDAGKNILESTSVDESKGIITFTLNTAAAATILTDYKLPTYLFNGYCIKATSSLTGAIVGVNMLSSSTKLVISYAKTDSTNTAISLAVDASTPWFNQLTHDYSTANSALQNQVNGDKSIGDSVLFSQTLAGVRTYIHVATSNTIPSDMLMRAEIEVPIIDRYNEAGIISLLDIASNTKVPGTIEDSILVFDITQVYKGMLKDPSTNKGFRLIFSNELYYFGRLILKGTKYPGDQMKLNVAYSTLNK